jgi:benzodiazapine receptor
MRFFLIALGFLTLNFGGLAVGSWFTGPGVASDWYQGLDKAPWTPPGYVFGAAWTTVMIGFSWFMYAAWTRTPQRRERLVWLIWFAVSWVLNALWNPLFFGAQELGWALLEILILFAVIAAMAKKGARQASLGAARWGIAPYILWLTVAISLNMWLVFS